MIRFIIERHEVDLNINLNRVDYFTIDIEVQELEKFLKSGGSGPMGFEQYKLAGVEILSEQKGGTQ